MARILVVDDEPNNRLLLATILEHAGHRILEAADGETALRSAAAAPPDLVIADLHLPGLSGADLIRALRASARTTPLRIALYTATAPDATFDEFVAAAHIDGIIPKPSEPQAVLRIVNELLAKR